MTATEEAATVSGEVARREPEGRVSVGGHGIMAVRADQEWWNKAQIAGLQQLGIASAPQGDLAVYLHYVQRTGLDPFARQIHMIKRMQWDSEVGHKVPKWTIQVGIDGFRTIRDRAERRDHVRVEFEDTVWIDAAGRERTVWLTAEAPAACRVTLVKLTPEGHRLRFPAVLRTAAYIGTNAKGEPAAQWKTQPDHMIEKCCEAFASRRAFPQDLGGVYIAEEMDSQDYSPPVGAGRPAQPERAQRERPSEPQTVAGRVEPHPDAPEPPAQTDTPAAGQEPQNGQQGTGEAPRWEPAPFAAESFDRAKSTRAMRALLGKAGLNKAADADLRLRLTGLFAVPVGQTPAWLTSSSELSDEQLHRVVDVLRYIERRCEAEGKDFRGHLEELDARAAARWPRDGDSAPAGDAAAEDGGEPA